MRRSVAVIVETTPAVLLSCTLCERCPKTCIKCAVQDAMCWALVKNAQKNCAEQQQVLENAGPEANAKFNARIAEIEAEIAELDKQADEGVRAAV